MPRMRYVYDNDMVAHIWANQSQCHARNKQGNLSFRDSVIFSYSTGIARILEKNISPVFERVVFVTERGYSKTTCKHKIIVNRALRILQDDNTNDMRVVVPDIYDSPQENQRTLLCRLNISLARHRKKPQQSFMTRNKIWIEEIAPILRTLGDLDFCKFDSWVNFSLLVNLEESLQQHVEDVDKIRDKEEKKYQNKVAVIERLKKERETRIENLLGYKLFSKSETEQNQSLVDLWRNGKIGHDDLHKFVGEELYLDLLRVTGNQIQTSRGATVDKALAKDIWDSISAEVDKHASVICKTIHPPVVLSIRAGNFVIQSMRTTINGLVLKAGCHTIRYSEFVRIAKELGLIDGDSNGL